MSFGAAEEANNDRARAEYERGYAAGLRAARGDRFVEVWVRDVSAEKPLGVIGYGKQAWKQRDAKIGGIDVDTQIAKRDLTVSVRVYDTTDLPDKVADHG